MFGMFGPTKDIKSRQAIVYLMTNIAEPWDRHVNAASVCEWPVR